MLQEGAPIRLLESQDSAGANQRNERTQDRERIGKKHQDVASNGSVKGIVARDLRDIALQKGHIVEAGFGNAGVSPRNGARVAFKAHNCSRRTNEPGQQQTYVSNAGAKIKDALAWANASFPEAALRVRSEPSRLADQPLVFCVGAAESVLLGRLGSRHDCQEF